MKHTDSLAIFFLMVSLTHVIVASSEGELLFGLILALVVWSALNGLDWLHARYQIVKRGKP